jgi:hypothetical protein
MSRVSLRREQKVTYSFKVALCIVEIVFGAKTICSGFGSSLCKNQYHALRRISLIVQ